MSGDALFTLAILAATLGAILSARLPVDIALAGAAAMLLVTGVLTPEETFLGFANPALWVIVCFYVVSAAMKESGALTWWIQRLLGHGGDLRGVLTRLIAAVAAASSLIANTPVVAIFIPQVQDWARRHRVASSQLLLPLSYAAIVGGTLSLIGTSTNLLLVGLMQGRPELEALSLFSPAQVGIPLVALLAAYFALVGRRLLPDRDGVSDVVADARQYAVPMEVDPDGVLAGKTIAEAGLRHLRYSFLSEIQSGGRVIPAVGPDEVIHGGDILVFVGQPEAVSELRRIPGLKPAERHVFKLDVPMSFRALIEAVVAPNSNLAGKTVKESLFRTQFGGAILAVSRDGRKIDMKVGDIVLRPGDTLLIEAPADFVRRHRYHRDFLLLSQLDGATLPDHGKAPVALAALGLFVLTVVSGLLPLVTASVLLVAGLGLFRCINLDLAQRSVDARVVLAIGASLALGYALQKTGLASAMAGVIAALGGESPWLNLVLLYLFTVATTELVTNNAAVVLAYPVAVSLAERLEVSLLPFALAIMFAASMSFMTPFGYQTNLMVQGPGGYHGRDYLRVGGPFSLLAAVVVLALVPIFWPFHP